MRQFIQKNTILSRQRGKMSRKLQIAGHCFEHCMMRIKETIYYMWTGNSHIQYLTLLSLQIMMRATI